MRINTKRKVWIIQPLVHGNGGWYGSQRLSSKRGMQLNRALKINPFDRYDTYNDYYHTSNLGAPRICISQDVNKSLYYYDGEENRWTKT